MIRCFEEGLKSAGVREDIHLDDLLATAAFLTWMTIHLEILGLNDADMIIASGGGVENAAIMTGLRAMDTPVQIIIESQAKEAIAFALLGAATLDGIPSNVPSVTGAKRPVVLGSITPRP